MGKMVGKAAPVSSYIGKSAAGASGKAGKLMPSSKTPIGRTASGLTGGGTPKPSTTRHGSGFIAGAKTAK